MSLHPRNPHSGRYDLNALKGVEPALAQYLIAKPDGDLTIDFANANAVLSLNKALLMEHYNLTYWAIPAGFLCPPIPGRADYIHYLGDLLALTQSGEFTLKKPEKNTETKKASMKTIEVPLAKRSKIPKGKSIQLLDIGTGANCIYPILGSQAFGWRFVAADTNRDSIAAAGDIVARNEALTHVQVRHQSNSRCYFNHIIKPGERFDITMCNPPFHASLEDALAGNSRKRANLSHNKKHRSAQAGNHSAGVKGAGRPSDSANSLNFGGQHSELWCDGGELAFLRGMVNESVQYRDQVCWFTTLVSKKENIRPLKAKLTQSGASFCSVITMGQGQKRSRILVWSHLNQEQIKRWASERF